MVQRFSIALAQVKAGKTSENSNVLGKLSKQVVYFLYQAKQITWKLYNNVVNSTKLKNGKDTIFMNFENSKTNDLHRLLLNLADKTSLKGSYKYVALLKLNILLHRKYQQIVQKE